MNAIPEWNDLIDFCDFKDEIQFLLIDVEESVSYIEQKYELRLHGILENGQKLRVDVTGIKPFFPVECLICDFSKKKAKLTHSFRLH
jgi:hypothetical protein